jgi:hypothetical protein
MNFRAVTARGRLTVLPSGGGGPTGVCFFLSADFVIPNPAPSAPASPASGRTVQSSRKQGETPFAPGSGPRFSSERPLWSDALVNCFPGRESVGASSLLRLIRRIDD